MASLIPLSMLPVLATNTDSRELESESLSLPAESTRLVTTDVRAYLFSILEPGTGIFSLIAQVQYGATFFNRRFVFFSNQGIDFLSLRTGAANERPGIQRFAFALVVNICFGC